MTSSRLKLSQQTSALLLCLFYYAHSATFMYYSDNTTLTPLTRNIQSNVILTHCINYQDFTTKPYDGLGTFSAVATTPECFVHPSNVIRKSSEDLLYVGKAQFHHSRVMFKHDDLMFPMLTLTMFSVKIPTPLHTVSFEISPNVAKFSFKWKEFVEHKLSVLAWMDKDSVLDQMKPYFAGEILKFSKTVHLSNYSLYAFMSQDCCNHLPIAELLSKTCQAENITRGIERITNAVIELTEYNNYSATVEYLDLYFLLFKTAANLLYMQQASIGWSFMDVQNAININMNVHILNAIAGNLKPNDLILLNNIIDNIAVPSVTRSGFFLQLMYSIETVEFEDADLARLLLYVKALEQTPTSLTEYGRDKLYYMYALVMRDKHSKHRRRFLTYFTFLCTVTEQLEVKKLLNQTIAYATVFDQFSPCHAAPWVNFNIFGYLPIFTKIAKHDTYQAGFKSLQLASGGGYLYQRDFPELECLFDTPGPIAILPLKSEGMFVITNDKRHRGNYNLVLGTSFSNAPFFVMIVETPCQISSFIQRTEIPQLYLEILDTSDCIFCEAYVVKFSISEGKVKYIGYIKTSKDMELSLLTSKPKSNDEHYIILFSNQTVLDFTGYLKLNFSLTNVIITWTVVALIGLSLTGGLVSLIARAFIKLHNRYK